MTEDYKSAVKGLCNRYGLIPFIVGGEFRVYRTLRDFVDEQPPLTVFCYRDPDSWTRASIENQIIEACLAHGF